MIHPIYDRQPTPREVARLQVLLDWYVLNGPCVKFHSDTKQDKYEQVVDSIPVLMAKGLVKNMRLALDSIEDND